MITYYHVSNFTTLIMPIMACNVKLARMIEGYDMVTRMKH